MTGDRTKFKDLDEGFKSQVRLGDNKQLRIEGQGTTEISIGNKNKFIQDVCYAPCLAHNLLSVGQLMETGHSLLFDDGKCVVKHKATGKIIASAYMTSNRIQRKLMAPYSPEQNKVAERKNRTIVEMTHCMLKQKGERHKLDGKSQKHVFIGYCMQSKAYRLYEPISKKVVISQNVVFDEDASWNWDEKVVSVNAQDEVFTTFENREIPAPTSTSTSPVQSSPSTPTSSATRSLVSSPTSSGNNTKTGQMESMQLRRSEHGGIPRRRFQIEGESSSPQDMSNGDDPDDTFALFSSDFVHVEEALKMKNGKRL
ncbi:retrovirus-related pol polyprotein from transposon TNT 1-94 [Tanacetum coccineum]|uniref:Retrovirus-related pol polyprotein from transposon TNT 1-94 n=1 Tax=Tanacetum coccineum TaxID=301880 RepID=A0ABQ5D8M9_9ASTR